MEGLVAFFGVFEIPEFSALVPLWGREPAPLFPRARPSGSLSGGIALTSYREKETFSAVCPAASTAL